MENECRTADGTETAEQEREGQAVRYGLPPPQPPPLVLFPLSFGSAVSAGVVRPVQQQAGEGYQEGDDADVDERLSTVGVSAVRAAQGTRGFWCGTACVAPCDCAISVGMWRIPGR